LLTMAAYVNSLSIVIKGTLLHTPLPTLLYALSLFFTLAGSVAYCMGSLGYFPQVQPNSSPGCTTQWDPLTLGTNLYVIGATFYVVSGILNLTAAWAKGRQHRAEEDRFRGESAGRLRLKAAIATVEVTNASRHV